MTIDVLQARLLKVVSSDEDGKKTTDYFVRSVICSRVVTEIAIGVARVMSLQLALLVTL